ncbi:hypothetical protein GQ55_3G383100 [Panicum hallii var. hallii]|uniref:Uncharacterized protein n=1 Tax=Panicum hallii var. hallii TaxID=1504633 RepID=A0A2T7EGE3_9POAL|nr:hypothetical protein GQ55_3G383100 [Panicum hallii var. hallii]
MVLMHLDLASRGRQLVAQTRFEGFCQCSRPVGLGEAGRPGISTKSIHPTSIVWWMVIMDQPHLISLNLIQFAPSCGRPILGGSLLVVSFVFACSSRSYGSIRAFLLVLWQGMICLAKV